jgi:hypothetical protein
LDGGYVNAMDEDRNDIRWMSYEELAKSRGITKASATRLAFRRHWRRQVGNDGTARVAVPLTQLQDGKGEYLEATPDDRDDVPSVVMVLEGTITLLREQVERERHLADEARVDLRTEREAGREREAASVQERRLLADRISLLEAELAAAKAKRRGRGRMRFLLGRRGDA